jgi:hypothetical protein
VGQQEGLVAFFFGKRLIPFFCVSNIDFSNIDIVANPPHNIYDISENPFTDDVCNFLLLKNVNEFFFFFGIFFY